MKNSNVITIKPRNKIFFASLLLELWEFRDLFFILVEKEIRVRYKQTILGVGWVLFQPLISTLIFTLLFGRLIKLPSGYLPYPLFSFVGMIYWTYFANSLSTSSGSVVGNEGIIKKVYFPRIILPISSIVAHAVDFIVSLPILGIFMIYYKVLPSLQFLMIFVFGFAVVTVSVAGMGFFLGALNVKYRDVRFLLPFLIQILIFLTPIFYPLSIVSPERRWILSLNPISTVIESSRDVLAGGSINYQYWLISLLSTLAFLIVGYAYFKKTESHFSDII